MPVASVRFRRRSDRLWLLGALSLLALVLLNTWRVPISEKLLPDAGLNRNLELAQEALHKGELSRRDGRGAKELFESVLAIDPDRIQAREGLLAVRRAALARAETALRRRRLEEARSALALADALSAPQVQLQPLRARLQVLEEESVDIPALLARAAAPEVGDEEALALLAQVLAIDAGNELALEGRHELFSEWLLQAEHELDAGHVEAARARIERVLAADPGHVDLPPLRARLGELAAVREREAARQLERARTLDARRAERTPGVAQSPQARAAQREAARLASDCFSAAMAAGHPRRAQGCLASWLALDPTGERSNAARAELAERWLAIAEERIGASDWRAAREALTAARYWQPQNPNLPALEARLQRALGGG